MQDSISRNITGSLTNLADESFGKHYTLVDSTHASATGLMFYSAYALTDITGLTIGISQLPSGSAAFPTDIKVGVKLPGSIGNIAVTGGTLLCMYE